MGDYRSIANSCKANKDAKLRGYANGGAVPGEGGDAAPKGKAKGSTTVNVIIAPQGGASGPAMPAPMPPMPPSPPPGLAGAGGPGPLPMRKNGGRVTAGSGSGLGRLHKSKK